MAYDVRAAEQPTPTPSRIASALRIFDVLAFLAIPVGLSGSFAYDSLSNGHFVSGVFLSLLALAAFLSMFNNAPLAALIPAQNALATITRLLWDAALILAIPAALSTPALGFLGGEVHPNVWPFVVASTIFRIPAFIYQPKNKAPETGEQQPSNRWTARARIEAGIFALTATILLVRGALALNGSFGLLNALWIVLAVFLIGSPWLLMGWSNDRKKRDSNTRKL